MKDVFLYRFKGLKPSGEGWTAKCPAHDDKQNSLSINRGEGKWLVKCHAGCSIHAVAAAVGLKLAARQSGEVLTFDRFFFPFQSRFAVWRARRKTDHSDFDATAELLENSNAEL